MEELLTSVVTYACGNFCVWIPRFEIEWILRWREERFCFPKFFVKPSLADLLKNLVEGPGFRGNCSPTRHRTSRQRLPRAEISRR